MRKTETERVRVTKEDKETLELASKMSDMPKSEIIRLGAIREAKKILKQIEKGK